MQKEQLTGLILAGGRGSRMGGVDKGLQLFQEQPMVQHVLSRLQPQVGQLMINANQNLSRYAEFGLPVWPDALAGFAGPLAGLQTGLAHCSSDYLVTAPCDSPFLPEDLVQDLAQALESAQADLAVAATGTPGTPSWRVHPVFCLVRQSLLPHLTAYLEKGGRKIDDWYASLKVVEVPFADEDAFRNINTRQELERYETGE